MSPLKALGYLCLFLELTQAFPSASSLGITHAGSMSF